MPLNEPARAAIADLRASGVADLSPDEVMALQDCGDALLRARRKDGTGPVAEPPVEVGGIVLHPMTLCAADYLVRAGRCDRPENRLWHVVVALANARDPAALDALDTRWRRWLAARGIMRRCAATRGEVERAVEMVMGGDRVDAETEAIAATHCIADYIEPDDRALAQFIREKAFGHIARHGTDRERMRAASGAEAKPAPDVAFWHGMAAEMAALTGTDAALWLATDSLLFVRLWREAHEREEMRQTAALQAFGSGRRESVAPEMVAAIKAMQDEKARIRARRKPQGEEVANG